MRGISVVVLAAAVATIAGYGPFGLSAGSPTLRSFLLQGFIAVMVLSNLPLVALLCEVTRLESKSREANRRLSLAETIAHMGHWHLEVSSGVLTWSDGVYRIHGLDPAASVPTLETAVSAYHPDDRDEIARSMQQALDTIGDY